MAGGRGIRPPAERYRLRIPVRAAERAVVQRRPVPGNSPSDRKDYPDFESPQESLRRCPPARPITRSVARRECALVGEQNFAFSRHDGIFRPGRGLKPSQTRGRVPRPVGRPRAPVQGRDGRNCAPYSPSAMSSGRLFLDRVGRHQSPSPLHRQPQHNMHSSHTLAKGDISTLPGTRHFYFALTQLSLRLDFDQSSSIEFGPRLQVGGPNVETFANLWIRVDAGGITRDLGSGRQ